MPAIRRVRQHPPGYIPRPRNAFMIFRAKIAKTLVAEHGAMSQGEISRRAGIAWKKLAPKVKLDYKRAAEREKQEHLKNYPTYKYQPMSKAKKAQLKEEKAKGKARQARGNTRPSADDAAVDSGEELAHQYMPPPLPLPIADYQGAAMANATHKPQYNSGQRENTVFRGGATHNYDPFYFSQPSTQDLVTATHADSELQQTLNDVFSNVGSSSFNQQMPLASDTQALAQFNLAQAPVISALEFDIGQMGAFDNFNFAEWHNQDVEQGALRGDLIQPGPYAETFNPVLFSQTSAQALETFDFSPPLLDSTTTVYDDGSGVSTFSGYDSLLDGFFDASTIEGLPVDVMGGLSFEDLLAL